MAATCPHTAPTSHTNTSLYVIIKLFISCENVVDAALFIEARQNIYRCEHIYTTITSTTTICLVLMDKESQRLRLER